MLENTLIQPGQTRYSKVDRYQEDRTDLFSNQDANDKLKNFQSEEKATNILDKIRMANKLKNGPNVMTSSSNNLNCSKNQISHEDIRNGSNHT